MTTHDKQDPLLEPLTEALDQQSEALDAATLSQLRQARARALEEMDKKRPVRPTLVWAGGLVSACAMVLAVVLVWPNNQDFSPVLTQEFADIDLLMEEDNMELYEELDFYIWLQAQEPPSDEA